MSIKCWGKPLTDFADTVEACMSGPTTEAERVAAGVPTEVLGLPDDTTLRKHVPVVTGCLDYFPDAIAAVAELSYAATQQHHPGSPMHWDRNKSTDHADCAGRHLLQRGTLDTDGKRHSTKLAWRALAMLQLEIEAAKRSR